MKMIRFIFPVNWLACMFGTVFAAGPNFTQGRDSELSQGLSDDRPLMGTPSTTWPSPQEIHGNAQRNEQAERELIQLLNLAIAPANGPLQKLKAGQAAWLSGLIHLHGAGVPVNPGQAKQWFMRSASYGQKIASAGLAWCAYDGCQSSPDLSEAQAQALILMSIDRARAQYMLWLIEEKMRPLHELNSQHRHPSKSAQSMLLQQAATGGSVHAMLEMGINAVNASEYQQALIWFERAVPQSEAARVNVQRVRKYLDTEQSEKQRTMGGLAAQSAESLFTQARRHHRGDGVTVNYVEAIRLYRASEAAGNPDARKMLLLIFSRTSPDGNIDLTWMRQLAERDISSAVPKQADPAESSLMQREISPLIDLLPVHWRNRVANSYFK